MEYLLGSPNDFYAFVNSISEEDKVGIVTHTDVDGIVSGIFLQKILESKNIKINFIEFLNYGSGVLKDLSERRDFDKLFFCDWKADEYIRDVGLLRKKGAVFIIDHHPLNLELEDKSGIIKTDSSYCSSHTLFDLAKGGNYFDTKSWEWLVCVAIVMDYTFNDNKVFEFLNGVYPEIKKENIFESVPGKNGTIIGNALIYYKPNIKKIYDSVLKSDLNSLKDVSLIIEEEIKKTEKQYLEEAEYYPEKNLYYGFVDPKFGSISTVISKVSHNNPDKIFVIVSNSGTNDGFVKVSSRAQSGKVDLNLLLKRCVEGFENSSAGGHVKAAAGSFPEKYLEEFKKRLLGNL